MVAGWSEPLVAVVVLWAVVAIGCLPLLSSSRIRGAIARWPTDRLAVNYVGLLGVVVFVQAGIFLARVVVSGRLGGVELVRWTFAVAAGYPLLLWLGLVAATAATGHWASASERRGHWVAFGLAAVWYAVVVATSSAVVFLVLFAWFFPG